MTPEQVIGQHRAIDRRWRVPRASHWFTVPVAVLLRIPFVIAVAYHLVATDEYESGESGILKERLRRKLVAALRWRNLID